jgi:hypothetical protein
MAEGASVDKISDLERVPPEILFKPATHAAIRSRSLRETPALHWGRTNACGFQVAILIRIRQFRTTPIRRRPFPRPYASCLISKRLCRISSLKRQGPHSGSIPLQFAG